MKKLFSTRYSDNGISFALLVLRLTMGGLLITHGFQKLVSFGEKADTFADPFHIGPSLSMALVVFAEFFCSAFVILGLFTRLACIPPIIAMSVALFFAHNGDVFNTGEKSALFLGGFLTLLFTGPGKVSIDRLISR
ncbi:MAG: DoxX family protein [Chitinophagaceae bacterium]